MTTVRTVFLDRDGTLMRDTEYPSHPDQVELLPGAAESVRRLNAAGARAIIVTNQSGIGRGYLTEDDYARVSARFDELMRGGGASIDAYYHCPHAPGDGCACRKPGVELFKRAIADHNLDPAQLAFIGDRMRDVLPADSFPGAVGILVRSGMTPVEDGRTGEELGILVDSIDEAVSRVLASY